MELHATTFRATVVLVVASILLAAPGFAGLGATLPLVVGLAALAAAAFAFRDRFAAWPTVLGYDLGQHGAVLWAGPAVATLVCLVGLGTTHGELQALGGLVGLAGMGNYFLRPVYRAGYALARRVGA